MSPELLASGSMANQKKIGECLKIHRTRASNQYLPEKINQLLTQSESRFLTKLIHVTALEIRRRLL